MHFFYLDETGCSGADLNPAQDPIFVLGGVAVKDQGWVASTQAVEQIFRGYFAPNPLPADFELHAHQLLSPHGEGPFAGHPRAERNQLAFDLLDVLTDRGHQVHFIALDKTRLAENADGNEHPAFDSRVPYLVGFNYLTTYINWLVKERLGHTARGIIILDEKELFDAEIARITRYRRFEVPNIRRIKWLVEFSYSIDSRRHPMIQLTDLVIFCARKFFELDGGYRPDWPAAARTFYAQCFDKLYSRVTRKTLVDEPQGGVQRSSHSDARHAAAQLEGVLRHRVTPRMSKRLGPSSLLFWTEQNENDKVSVERLDKAVARLGGRH